jgi:hypothetical protein
LILYIIIGSTSKYASKEPEKDLDALSTWLTNSSPELNKDGKESCILPHWTALQPLFLQLELLKCTIAFIDTAITLSKQKAHHTNGKLSADALNKIKKTTKEQAELIQTKARDWKKLLDKNGFDEVLKALTSGGSVGDVIGDVVGKDRMRKYAREFVESGGECLDGVGKVKV